MARASANKLYRTFVKGLVTEASPLTYPEDTSYDELNTILSRKGSRTRRRGINYSSSTTMAALEVTSDTDSQSEFTWSAVNQLADTNFLVIQRGLTINFIDLASTDASSLKSFSIDMSSYVIDTWSTADAAKQVFQMDAGKGFLFIVSRGTDPVLVKYLPDEDDIEVTKLTLLIRDVDGVYDGLANDEEPTTLTAAHHYNLLNQGWLYSSTTATSATTTTLSGYDITNLVGYYDFETGSVSYVTSSSYSAGPIKAFYDEIGRYPGNNKQWWAAKAATDDDSEDIEEGDFLPDVLNRLFSGNNRAARGHYILNAFDRDRSTVSGISTLTSETFDYRPEAIAFFSGRAWYGAGSTVYFSQILDSTGPYKAALCYQEADPTSEDISDLIASDGGVVPIPEASRIRKLLPIGNGVLVFAQNGVWFVSGGDSAFSATNIALDKTSAIGTKSPYAAIAVSDVIFWWSEVGIQAIQQSSGSFGNISGKFGNTNISEQTIQTLVNEVGETEKTLIKACYDPRNNRVMWLFNDAYDESYTQYNKVLLYDLTLQAFFLWDFSQIDSGPTIRGFYNNIGEAYSIADEDIVDSTGELVVDSADEQVVGLSTVSTYTPSSIYYLVNLPGEGMAQATVTDSGYVDWSSWDGTGVTYSSFIETGYELLDDAQRQKQMTYVSLHFRQLEGSSCKFTTKWDWASGVGSNRWSVKVEGYRERTRPSVDSYADLSAFEVVTTKNKVRGSGKAIQFRFECSEAGKNFDLLGWSVTYTGNTVV